MCCCGSDTHARVACDVLSQRIPSFGLLQEMQGVRKREQAEAARGGGGAAASANAIALGRGRGCVKEVLEEVEGRAY